VKSISVLPINCGVKFHCSPEISGLITGVLLRGENHITYEVAWFASGVRYSQWVEVSEITPVEFNYQRATLGFREAGA
jgi:hypothetical protein